MDIHRKPFCTDEELLNELRKLGYDEVSPEVFNTMKDDLALLVEKQLKNSSSLPDVSGNLLSPSAVEIASVARENAPISSRLLSDSQKTGNHYLRKTGRSIQTKKLENPSDKKPPVIGCSISKYKSTLNNYKMKKNLIRTQPDIQSDSDKGQKLESTADACRPDVFNNKITGNFSKMLPNKEANCDKIQPSVENCANKYKAALIDTEKNESGAGTQEQIVDSNCSRASTVNDSHDKYFVVNDSKPDEKIEELVANPVHDKVSLANEDADSHYESNDHKVNENLTEALKPSVVNEDNISSIDDALDRYRHTINKYKSREIYRKTYNPLPDVTGEKISPTYDFSVGKYREMINKYRLKENLSVTHGLGGLAGISDTRPVPLTIGKYRDTLNNYKLKQNLVRTLEAGSDPNSSYSDAYRSVLSSSLTGNSKTIKRKVLRHRNGRAVITEEILAIPSILNTSYPETDNLNSSKSFSSDDLSWHSNSSSGSVSGLSPHSMINSHSSFSLSSVRSVTSRLPIPRKKKSDPVAMYGYYRRYWDSFKPPGEKTHDKLRWAVRDKMLEYNL